MPFQFEKTSIDGLILVKPKIFKDERGFFAEEYKKSEFVKAGINCDFVQDNRSKSSKGVLRGLHFQKEPFAQAKLVRCIKGKIWDVAADLRKGSKTYGKWLAFELSEENFNMLFIPEGFAHGFLTLSEEAEVFYKCSREYSPSHDSGIKYDDPFLSVKWPLREVFLSEKDKNLPYLEVK
ncbi:MAG: dTDP-4-dehydrorhamnose 3,5-epimerase [Elusimicrobia bacterium]|nr:dTDP-4-dehydrorhamnose 3,5-epimerase [Elusimicrobiota bacterium]